VFAHDREGQNIDVEGLDLTLDALFQPITAVLGDIAIRGTPTAHSD